VALWALLVVQAGQAGQVVVHFPVSDPA